MSMQPLAIESLISLFFSLFGGCPLKMRWLAVDIRAIGYPNVSFDKFYAHARADPSWRTYEHGAHMR